MPEATITVVCRRSFDLWRRPSAQARFETRREALCGRLTPIVPLQHSITTERDHLVVSYTGEWERETQLEVLQQAISQCRQEGRLGIVIDGRALTSQPDELDRYLAAERLGELGKGLRFAAVWQAEHISGLAQDVARSRGIDLLVTDSWDEAVEFVRGA